MQLSVYSKWLWGMVLLIGLPAPLFCKVVDFSFSDSSFPGGAPSTEKRVVARSLEGANISSIGSSIGQRKKDSSVIKSLSRLYSDYDTVHYLNTPNINNLTPLFLNITPADKAIAETKKGKSKPSNSLIFDARYYLFIGVLLLSAFFLPVFTGNTKNVRQDRAGRTPPTIAPEYMGLILFAITCFVIFVSNSLNTLNVSDQKATTGHNPVYTISFFFILLTYYFLGHYFVRRIIHIYQPQFLATLHQYHFVIHIGMLVSSLIVLLLIVTDTIAYNTIFFVFMLLIFWGLEFLLQIGYLIFKIRGMFIYKISFILLALIVFAFLKLGVVIFVFKQFL